MKISELVKQLQHAQERHGDMDVFERGEDTYAVDLVRSVTGVTEVGHNPKTNDDELLRDYDKRKRADVHDVKRVFVL